MTIERKKQQVAGEESFSEYKERLVKYWSEISSKLPKDLSPHDRQFARDYFRAQLRIARGQRKKAKRIFQGLDRKTGFREFEEKNQELLVAIELAVRGSSNRKDNLGNRIEPLFTLNGDTG